MVWFTTPPRLTFDLGNDVSVTYLQALTVAQVTWHGGLDLCDSRHQVIRGCDKPANCTITGCNFCSVEVCTL